MSEHRLLFFDLESAPIPTYVWGAHDQYVRPDALERDTYLLSWASKWSDRKRVQSAVVTPEEAMDDDDGRIVAELADIMRDADSVVAHNAKRFDVPLMNARLLQLGLEPLGPVRVIDTLSWARQSFKLASNSLDYLAWLLGVDGKLPTDFNLWRRSDKGDEKALKRMARYNRRDVEVLEAVYYKLLPYAVGVPRLVDADPDGNRGVCSRCGEDALQKRGFHYTAASTYQRYQCTHCKKWDRDRKAISERKLDTVPLR